MKKFILFSLAALALSMASCGSSDDKIDPKKDAQDLAKAIVGVIDKTEVKDQAGLDSLKQKVDSMEVTFYKFYEEYKKNENENTLDSLKKYYLDTDKPYRHMVDSALQVKEESIKPKE